MRLRILGLRRTGERTRQREARAAEGYLNPLAPREPHFEPRAKRVIFLCMRGGPSHVDTFDYKPALAEFDGKNPGALGDAANGHKVAS